MSSDAAPQRTVRVLSRGSRLCVAAAVALQVVAAYLFYVPLQYVNAAGAVIVCGSAARPPTEPLVQLACGDWPTERRVLALAVMALGIVVLVGGLATFGTAPRTDGAPGAAPPAAPPAPARPVRAQAELPAPAPRRMLRPGLHRRAEDRGAED